MTKYYFPVCRERMYPDLSNAAEEILNIVLKGKTLTVYTGVNEATKAGEKMLFDDDAYNVFELAQYGESDYELRQVEHNDYIWIPKVLTNYLTIRGNTNEN